MLHSRYSQWITCYLTLSEIFAFIHVYGCYIHIPAITRNIYKYNQSDFWYIFYISYRTPVTNTYNYNKCSILRLLLVWFKVSAYILKNDTRSRLKRWENNTPVSAVKNRFTVLVKAYHTRERPETKHKIPTDVKLNHLDSFKY